MLRTIKGKLIALFLLGTFILGCSITAFVMSGGIDKTLISRDEAISIAKEEVDATPLRAKLDKDDGISIYEVKLRDGYTEYEVEVDAVTGYILNVDTDYVSMQ